MADENATAPERDHLNPAERAYFDSRGEKPIPEPKPTPAPAPAAQSELPLVEAPRKDQPAADPTEPSGPSEPTAKEQPKVNAGALADERNRRREAEERARQAELQQARMEERFRAWQQQVTPRQPPPSPPDPNKDIFGAVNHVLQKQQYTEREIAAYKQQIAAENTMRQVGLWAADQEIAFKKATPDYDAALNHIRDLRRAELRHGFNMTEMAAEQQLIAEERDLLIRAARQNRNPAQMIYGVAKARGFTGAPAPAAQAQTDERQLDRVEAGQQASRSLSNIGGRAGGGTQIGIEDLLKMPDRDYETFKARNPAKFRRLMGAR